MKVGTLVKLKVDCLGNKVGAIGVCFYTYNSRGHKGVQVIFENGNYDGFSTPEQDYFLEIIDDTSFHYEFTNVIKLSEDFRNGVFDFIKPKRKGQNVL